MFDFRLAVIGPTAVGGLGLAAGCMGCAARNPAAHLRCGGFGPGCLGAAGQGAGVPDGRDARPPAPRGAG